MFELWRHKWAVWKINRKTAQETKKLKKQKAGPDAFQELEWSEHNAIEDAEKDFA